jgi:hypothetical protein
MAKDVNGDRIDGQVATIASADAIFEHCYCLNAGSPCAPARGFQSRV